MADHFFTFRNLLSTEFATVYDMTILNIFANFLGGVGSGWASQNFSVLKKLP